MLPYSYTTDETQSGNPLDLSEPRNQVKEDEIEEAAQALSRTRQEDNDAQAAKRRESKEHHHSSSESGKVLESKNPAIDSKASDEKSENFDNRTPPHTTGKERLSLPESENFQSDKEKIRSRRTESNIIHNRYYDRTRFADVPQKSEESSHPSILQSPSAGKIIVNDNKNIKEQGRRAETLFKPASILPVNENSNSNTVPHKDTESSATNLNRKGRTSDSEVRKVPESSLYPIRREGKTTTTIAPSQFPPIRTKSDSNVTTISINIGRIEIRATNPQARSGSSSSANGTMSPRQQPGISLQEYIRLRDEGKL
jgi:hypothetical protein